MKILATASVSTSTLGLLIIAVGIWIPRLYMCMAQFPDIPDIPSFPDNWSNNATSPTTGCGFVLLFFELQANQEGYECECLTPEEDNDEVVISCERPEPACDDTGGIVETICRTNTFSVSASRGNLIAEGNKTFAVEACSKYNALQGVPDFLAEREFCFVYRITLDLTKGFVLDQCGVNFDPVCGETKEVCTCGVCDNNTSIMNGFGLGLDCQVDLLLGITLEDCLPLTSAAPVVVPVISSVDPPKENRTDAPIPGSSAMAKLYFATTVVFGLSVSTCHVLGL